MSEKQNFFVRLGTPENPVRLSYPNLFKAKGDDEGKNPKFGANFIFPKDHPSLKELKKAITEAAKDKWPNKYESILKSLKANNKLCLKDGELKSDQPGYEGNMFVSANNKSKPRVVDSDAQAIGESDDGSPYPGCNVIATIDVWAQDHAKHGKRINASLRGVQFHSDNEQFGGAQIAAEDEFGSLGEGAHDDTDFDDDDDLV